MTLTIPFFNSKFSGPKLLSWDFRKKLFHAKSTIIIIRMNVWIMVSMKYIIGIMLGSVNMAFCSLSITTFRKKFFMIIEPDKKTKKCLVLLQFYYLMILVLVSRLFHFITGVWLNRRPQCLIQKLSWRLLNCKLFLLVSGWLFRYWWWYLIHFVAQQLHCAIKIVFVANYYSMVDTKLPKSTFLVVYMLGLPNSVDFKVFNKTQMAL